MRRLRRSSAVRACVVLPAAFTAVPVLPTASAPTETSRPSVQPAEQEKRYDVVMEPRRIAAAVVATDLPAPKLIVQVGAHHGEFLEVFLNKFPTARGLWIEPANSEPNLPAAKARLARFGSRVDYQFGCGERDISDGCVPQGADVIITDWVSILQNLDGMYRIYRIAAERLAPGGWFVNIDQAGFGGDAWEPRLQRARKGLRLEPEAPPIHHPEYRTPTVDEQLGAMRAAGFEAQVLWRSFNTILIMGRKQ